MSDEGGTYDYIVVGGGSAGCVIAARLSENKNAQVLLVEGGGEPDHPDVADPSKWPTLFAGEMDWGWTTAPLRACNNRIDHFPRGKMLGGCHSHNANAWVRATRKISTAGQIRAVAAGVGTMCSQSTKK